MEVPRNVWAASVLRILQERYPKASRVFESCIVRISREDLFQDVFFGIVPTFDIEMVGSQAACAILDDLDHPITTAIRSAISSILPVDAQIRSFTCTTVPIKKPTYTV